jgi:hypothetical protein
MKIGALKLLISRHSKYFKYFRHYLLIGKQLAGSLFFIIREMVKGFKGTADLGLEIPAGHLPQREPAGKLIGR